MALLGVASASTVAIGVTVVATLIVVALALSLLVALRAVRDLRAAAEELRHRTDAALAALEGTVAQAGTQLERVDDLVGSAERLTTTVGQASNLAYASMASPVIKLLAFGRGTARVSHRLRSGGVAATSEVPGPERPGGVAAKSGIPGPERPGGVAAKSGIPARRAGLGE